MPLTGFDIDFGEQIPIDPQYVVLTASENSSTRLGMVFPFEDQDIKDNVYTRSYFDGKISFNFSTADTDVTNSSNAHFNCFITPIDILQSETVSTGDVEFQWDTFDINNTVNSLVASNLDGCIDTPVRIYDSYNTTEQGADMGTFNHATVLDELMELEEWHEVNNFNSMVLLAQITKDESLDFAQAKCFVNLHDISMVHYVSFSAALDDPMYVNAFGRVNNPEDIIEVPQIDTNVVFNYYKYTGNIYTQDGSDLIERPCDVLYHLIEKEFLLDNIMNDINLNLARDYNVVDKLAFSVHKEIKAKDLITEISKSSNIFPVFKANSEFSLNVIAKHYNGTEVVETIKERDVLKFQISRTSTNRINTIVNVKYKYDYQLDEYKEETGYVDGYDMFGNADSWLREGLGGYSYGYLGLEREDRVLEFESKYIRDEASAIQLRDFIYMYHCNQHNILKLELPLRYLHLEAGDVVNFDKLIHNMKAYGEDYTRDDVIRNGQKIYPYFMITRIQRKMNKIVVEVTQLHDLRPDFQAYVGSVTRSRGVKNGIQEVFEYSEDDINELSEFLLGGKRYYTRGQKRVSDMNGNGYITTTDLFDLTHLYTEVDTVLGDSNYDGVVNVVDIVYLVNNILQNSEQQGIMEQYILDLTQDEIVNVVDIVALVNTILEEGY
mgnify:CR=1 FL=1|tara:strand:+ start:1103 stop:3094 length:1992 start_codon:yes stop_codon:yes gene_type:complete